MSSADTVTGNAPKFFSPPSVGEPIGEYSHVAQSGGTYFIAGQVAVDRKGNVVGDGDLTVQLTQTFANIGNILSSASTASAKCPATKR